MIACAITHLLHVNIKWNGEEEEGSKKKDDAQAINVADIFASQNENMIHIAWI